VKAEKLSFAESALPKVSNNKDGFPTYTKCFSSKTEPLLILPVGKTSMTLPRSDGEILGSPAKQKRN
jgi:hypothetical protein